MDKNKKNTIYLIGEELASLQEKLSDSFCPICLTKKDPLPKNPSLLLLNAASAKTVIPKYKKCPPWILVEKQPSKELLEYSIQHRAADMITNIEQTEICWRIKKTLQAESIRDNLEKERNSLKILSEKDPLTHCLNRRGFENQVQQAIDRAARIQHPIALMLMDLDNFKGINDTWGHPFGDQFLCDTAKILQNSTRSYDLVGRLGGDEFALFFCNITKQEAESVAKNLVNKMKKTQIDTGSAHIPITASIGVGTTSLQKKEHPLSIFQQLTQIADQALYQAKKTKGTVCCTTADTNQNILSKGAK